MLISVLKVIEKNLFSCFGMFSFRALKFFSVNRVLRNFIFNIFAVVVLMDS